MKYNRRVQLSSATICVFATFTGHALGQGTTYEWIGGGCGSGSIWIDPEECDNPPPCQVFNWDPATCNMSFMDTAIIPRGFTVSMINPVEVGTLQVQGLLKINNNLTVNSATLASVEIDSSSGPVFTALGPVTFNGNTTFSRGTLAGFNTFTVAGGEFHLSPIGTGLPRIIDGAILMNNAVVHADLSLQFRNAAEVFNSGTWRANGMLGDPNPANSLGVFKNFGSLVKDALGSTSVLVPLDNLGGSITVNAGTLNVNRGGNHSSGSYQLSGGSMSFQGFDDNGTPSGVRITGPISASGNGNLQLRFDRTIIESGGSLTSSLNGTFGLWIGDESSTRVQCDGALVNEGLMTWTGGRITRTNEEGGLANKAGGQLFIQVSNGQELNATLYNYGTVAQSASLAINAGDVNNQNGGLWTIASGDLNSSDRSFFGNHETGKVVKTGTGSSNVYTTYVNAGNTTIEQGTLDFRGGGGTSPFVISDALFHIHESATCRFSQGEYQWTKVGFDGSGDVRLDGATFHLVSTQAAESRTHQPGAFHFENGLMAGVGEFVNLPDGHMTWSGGTIAAGALGDGGVSNFGIFNVIGIAPAAKLLTGRLHTEEEMFATSFTIDGGLLTNAHHLTFTGGTVAAGASPGNILNKGAGSIIKTGGGTTNIWPPVTNEGTIDVQEGWLDLKVPPTNFTDGVLFGGTWRVRSDARLITPGAITATNSAASITLESGAVWDALTNHLIQNNGTLQVENQGQSTCSAPGGTLFNFGNLECGGGGTLKVNGTIDNSEGAVMQQSAATEGDGGTAGGSGDGGFIATTVNNHGIIRPGGEGAPGPFNLTGDLVCHATSGIEMELAGLTPIDLHDHLTVTGDIALAGTLHVSFLDAFEPAVGEQFTIITAVNGTITGAFESITGATNVEIDYTDSSVTLTVTEPQVPGDLTGDGSVGVPDLLILLGTWGTCADPSECLADLDKNDAVGVSDLLILLANWG